MSQLLPRTWDTPPSDHRPPEPVRDTVRRRLSRLLQTLDLPMIRPADPDAGTRALPPRADAVQALDDAVQAYEAWEFELHELVRQTWRAGLPDWATPTAEPFNAWFLDQDTVAKVRTQEFLALKVAVLNMRSVVDWMRQGTTGYTEYDWGRLIAPGGELSDYCDSVRCGLRRLRMKLLIRSF